MFFKALYAILIVVSIGYADYSKNGKDILKSHSSWKHGISEAFVLEKESFSIKKGEEYSKSIVKKAAKIFSGINVENDEFASAMLNASLEDSKQNSQIDSADLLGGSPRSEEHEALIRKKDEGSYGRNVKTKWLGKYQNEFKMIVHKERKSFRVVSLKEPKQLNQKFEMSEADLVGRSLRIIKKYQLIDQNTLGQLYFIKATHVHFTGKATDPNDRKVSTQIKFGRMINSIPIIGYKNSEVNFVFSSNVENAGDEDAKYLQEIDVDWPDLRISSSKQTMVDVDQFKKRVRGIYAQGELKKAGLSATTDNVKKIQKNAKIDRTICGYFDAESSSGAYLSAILQLGCMIVESPENNEKRSVLMIPAGKDVRKQEHWKVTHDIDLLEQLGEDAQLIDIKNSFEGGAK